MVTRESAASSAPDCAGRNGAHTPGPWDYVPSNEHHGPYVTTEYGSTVCDCYCMSNPLALSVRNGGTSKPIHHMHEMAEANARLIAAVPELAIAASAAERKLVELRALLADNGISCPCTDEIVQLQDALIKAGV